MSLTLASHLASAPALAAAAAPSAGNAQLVVAALVGIAVIVLLITQLKLHPFLALTVGSLVLGAVASEDLADVVTSFGAGVGSTVASVGTLIALGAMFGRLLADSGGADQIVDTIVGRASTRALPWAMALVGALIGLPMFFEIGLVLLMPVVVLVARRARLPLMTVGLPALAGLSVMHGLVPPHPGPLVTVAALKANLGITIGLGVLVAVPTVAIAGPVLARRVSAWVPVRAPAVAAATGGTTTLPDAGTDRRRDGDHSDSGGSNDSGSSARTSVRTAAPPASGSTAGTGVAGAGERADLGDGDGWGGLARRRPTFAVTLATVLLPVVLMLAKALVDVFVADGGTARRALDFLGTPLVALLIAVLVAMVTFGRGSGMDRAALSTSLERSLPPIAGILLIVAAGGGFKQTLVDSGIAKVVADAVAGSSISPLVLAWVVAVLIRLATGSATVATVTASGILAPLAATLSTDQTSLLVLAIGAGSLFFSHVNDAGFWLVKEYFGLTVGDDPQLVAHGDGGLGVRPRLRAAAEPGGLSGDRTWRTPRTPARARLPLLPSGPGGVQRDDAARGVVRHCSGSGGASGHARARRDGVRAAPRLRYPRRRRIRIVA